ncbi:MAG: dihydrofolate reductase family protein [Actinobacteria bacterium]|nr:dihydrofolate reductase family protein [Actinomycetota bacterium]
MAKLIYASNTSLDGFTEDADGELAWAPPDDDVFAVHTEFMGSVGTYLYGRRMYDAMSLWETDPSLAGRSAETARFAEVWQAADKVVFSSTLAEPRTARTRLESSFEPAAVADLKAAADGDLLVGGPHLAAQALAARLVDEVVLWVWPILLGGQNPALPSDVRADLELVGERRIGTGVVELRHRVR